MKFAHTILALSVASLFAVSAQAQLSQAQPSAPKPGAVNVPTGGGMSTHLGTQGADGGMAKDMDAMRMKSAVIDAQQQINNAGSPQAATPQDALSRSGAEQYAPIKQRQEQAALAQASKAGGCQMSCEKQYAGSQFSGSKLSASTVGGAMQSAAYAKASPEEKAKMDAEKKAKEEAEAKYAAEKQAKIKACVAACMAK